jgi:hypothetical protein
MRGVSSEEKSYPAAHPAHRPVQLREEWEQAIQDYGRQSGQARKAKRRYQRGLRHYLDQTVPPPESR